MKIKELIAAVAKLVTEREIVNHGTIRCLWSQSVVDAIMAAEGLLSAEDVGTGTIGDDELAAKLESLADDPEALADLDTEVIQKLADEFTGPEISDYLDPEEENKLASLDKLIKVARMLV